EGLAAAEDRVGGQQHDRPDELRVASRLEVPGRHRREGVLAGAELRLAAEGDALAIAEAIDDRDRLAVIAAGTVTDVDDEAFQVIEVASDLVQRVGQGSHPDVLQLEDADVADL